MDGMTEKTAVRVVDIHMPFGSMVVFILKWVLASIPAMFLLGIIAFIFAAVFGGIIASLIPSGG
jgi:hypothetical protein